MEDFLGDALDDDQRAQCFLRLTDGGLGLASAAQAAAAAYLGSWALTLHSVGACLDEPSWARFKERCPSVAEAIARAETRLQTQCGGSLEAIDWTGCMGEPLQGMQGKWAGDLRSKERERLLASLGTDDRVDFRSSGGPGARRPRGRDAS